MFTVEDAVKHWLNNATWEPFTTLHCTVYVVNKRGQHMADICTYASYLDKELYCRNQMRVGIVITCLDDYEIIMQYGMLTN